MNSLGISRRNISTSRRDNNEICFEKGVGLVIYEECAEILEDGDFWYLVAYVFSPLETRSSLFMIV